MSDAWKWEQEVCRKLSLRSLQIIFAVAEQGGMAKAALRLGITQSAVSQVVADLESELGVRLFDRSRRGVEPTVYGQALVMRARAAFDELRSGLSEIDHLRHEGAGDIRIGCPETLAASVLPRAIDSFSERWPRMDISVDTFHGGDAAEKLRSRSVDMVFMRGGPALVEMIDTGEYDVTNLFEDSLSIVVGSRSPLAKRRGIGLAELQSASWIMLPYGWGESAIPDAFRNAGLSPPRAAIRTFSVHLRLHLVTTGRYVSALPKSIISLYKPFFDLKVLPIEVPNYPYSVDILTYRNRTLTRAADLFIRSTAALFRTGETIGASAASLE
jgi:DNA-binding transcriptional LysR family regulator